MPGRGTPLRTYRLSEVLWERFGQAAKEAGKSRADLVRAFVLWFLRYPGAELPERPEPPAAGG